MKVEVDALGSPFMIVRVVSVDVKQHLKKAGKQVSKVTFSDLNPVFHGRKATVGILSDLVT